MRPLKAVCGRIDAEDVARISSACGSLNRFLKLNEEVRLFQHRMAIEAFRFQNKYGFGSHYLVGGISRAHEPSQHSKVVEKIVEHLPCLLVFNKFVELWNVGNFPVMP